MHRIGKVVVSRALSQAEWAGWRISIGRLAGRRAIHGSHEDEQRTKYEITDGIRMNSKK